MTKTGVIHIQQGDTFRRTHATIEQVLLALRLLVDELPAEASAVANARRVASLLVGHGTALETPVCGCGRAIPL